MNTSIPLNIPGAVQLSPLQLNAVHFSDKHTRLTPELLKQKSKNK